MLELCCQPLTDSPSEGSAPMRQCAICRPPGTTPDGYEVRVHVDFEKRLLRPLCVGGVGDDEPMQVLLFAREKCNPNCATTGCQNCRTRKLYEDTAGDPKGAIAFRSHSEYLYCLRFGEQPATALLSLTPREQSVEVKELGLLAYWFVNWLQRAKADLEQAGRVDADDDAEYLARLTPSAVVAEPTDAASARTTDSMVLNSSSMYLPNLRIIYQVKKQLMTVTLPEPQQLTRDIDVLLASRNSPTEQPQTISLCPAEGTVGGEMQTTRGTPYTLMLKLKGHGRPVKLLDLMTERKVLRVQESLLAPKHMNFLMERRTGERATFVLHITFDERPDEVDSRCLGEFYLDVDVDNKTLSIGTVKGHEQKHFRVEKLLGPETEDPLNCDTRMLLFEGGVNQKTLFTDELMSLERSSDYLITVLDIASGTELPTSLLSFRKTSLFVKEVKGSDVKLHVTVQRQYSPDVRNENNFPPPAEVSTVRRCLPDGAYHCPMRTGCAHMYRIQHNAARRRDRSNSMSSATTAAAATTDAAVAAAEDFCHSSGGSESACANFDDSGLGGNLSSLSMSLDSASAYYSQQRMRRRLHWEQENDQQQLQQQQQQQQQQQPQQQQQQQLQQQPQQQQQQQLQQQLQQQQLQQQPTHQVSNVNLDVDMRTMQARLLAGEDSGADPCGSCYVVMEDSLTDGRARPVPCLLGQAFDVRRWCRYTVKLIGENRVSPLFTFRLTDTEVTDIQPCNPTVRLSKNVSQR